MGMSDDLKNAWPPETEKEHKYIAIVVDKLRFQHGMNYEDIRTFIADKIGRPVSSDEYEDAIEELEHLGL